MESTDEQALLRTIFEQPHEDVPRLVYADWLEEHDQPDRAELIRLQCHLAASNAAALEKLPLENREKQLWQTHQSQWIQQLPEEIPFLLRYQSFHRGFPAPKNLELSVLQFLDLPDACFEVAPLWEIRLILHPEDRLWSLARSPRLKQVGSLELRLDENAPRILQELFETDQFTQLRELRLQGHPLRLEHLGVLSQSSCLQSLKKLVIFCNPIGPEGARLLANSPTFSELEALELSACAIGDLGLRELLESPYLQKLKYLHLPQNELAIESAHALLGQTRWQRLHELGLYCNHFGDDGTRMLAMNPVFEKLDRLDLGLNRIGRDGARALADSPFLNRLKQLHLMGNPFCDDPIITTALRSRFGERVVV